jgi:hypothetical protein
MDEWGWEQVRAGLDRRAQHPVGSLFCIIDGPTPRAIVVRRRRPHQVPPACRPRRGQAPVAPHQLRHAHASDQRERSLRTRFARTEASVCTPASGTPGDRPEQ